MALEARKTVAELSREYYEFTIEIVEQAINELMPVSAEEIYNYSYPKITSAFPDMDYSRERLEMDLETLLIDGRATFAMNLWKML